jgi:hypothetical protein
MVSVDSHSDLLEVVLATHAARGLAYFLHGGEQHPDQDGDDGNDHEQLDQCESAPPTPRDELRAGHVLVPEGRDENGLI